MDWYRISYPRFTWIALSSDDVAHAQRAAEIAVENARRMNLGDGRYVMREGDLHGKLIGMTAEVAVWRSLRLPVPSPEAMASTWGQPDVVVRGLGRFAVKGISKPDYGLLFDDTHLRQDFDAFVLVFVYGSRSRCGIVGWLRKAEAIAAKEWHSATRKWRVGQRRADFKPWPPTEEVGYV